MVINEDGRIIVSLPEYFTRQESNPNTLKPFASEAEAQAWEYAFLALAAQSAISAAEAEAARQAERKKEAHRTEVLARLAEIDRLSSSPRAQREALLGDLVWLTSLNTEAVALRAELTALAAVAAS